MAKEILFILVVIMIIPLMLLGITILQEEGEGNGVCEMWNPEASAEEIDHYLKEKWPKSPLNGKGKLFVETGQKYGINPWFILGVANAETGMGMYEGFDPVPYNFCNIKGATDDTMDTWEKAIEECFKKMEAYKDCNTMQDVRIKYCGYEQEIEEERYQAEEGDGILVECGPLIEGKKGVVNRVHYRCDNGPTSNWEVMVNNVCIFGSKRISNTVVPPGWWEVITFGAEKFNIPPEIIAAILLTEKHTDKFPNNIDPNGKENPCTKSYAGATGPFQIMPSEVRDAVYYHSDAIKRDKLRITNNVNSACYYKEGAWLAAFVLQSKMNYSGHNCRSKGYDGNPPLGKGTKVKKTFKQKLTKDEAHLTACRYCGADFDPACTGKNPLYKKHGYGGIAAIRHEEILKGSKRR